MVNNNTKYGMIAYFVLLFTTLFTPRNLMDFSHNWYSVVIGFYVISWIMILQYLNKNIKADYEHQMYDHLLIHLLYLLGLPIIFYSILFMIGVEMWEFGFVEIFYFIVLSLFILAKLLSFRNNHAGIVNFSIIMITPLANLIIINQILTAWYIINVLTF